MANVTTIEAEARERAGKGAARATRRAGMVPAVIYGAKEAPTICQLDPRIIMRELHRGGWRSRPYQLSVGGSTVSALMREVQFHPVSDKPIHVDFPAARRRREDPDRGDDPLRRRDDLARDQARRSAQRRAVVD